MARPAPEQGGRLRRVALGVLAAAAVVGTLWWATLAETGAHCEVCMQQSGRVYCSRVSAPTREEAEDAALRNACGTLAGNVTADLACQRTAPLSVDCGG